jgi:hypothetical protein
MRWRAGLSDQNAGQMPIRIVLLTLSNAKSGVKVRKSSKTRSFKVYLTVACD